ncbi:hypothetical protein CRV08_05850 [Halarcobacter ebronensis]|uniref:DUF2018 domain-containing protein n=1 Tax=Halarcobacter ebronensis TaxID=1462615 RepID=A0A4Q0YFG4_9BACT|nr:DUF2018 family protein [Halarcobacter ebronensis]RXJ68953.1 hypothetical protein CRV08_05850 [Halarcobacter ebronensis]
MGHFKGVNSMSKDWFLEDEDDIFIGSAKSKYFDIARSANKEIVEDEFDKLLEKLAVMELLLSKEMDEEFDINRVIKEYVIRNLDEVEQMKKGLYVELTGDIVSRLDS